MASNSTEIPEESLPPSSPPPEPSSSIESPEPSSVDVPAPTPPAAENPTPSADPAQPAGSPIIVATSIVTFDPATTGGAGQPSVVVVTLTSSPSFAAAPTSISTSISAEASSSSSSGAAALTTGEGDSTDSSGGLPQSGKIAVAVVVPIIVIALLVVGVLFLWKKRKATKSAEEQRKNEMEEYGFNPNNDPALPPVGMAYGEDKPADSEDGVGYRGWGTTNSATARQPSTNLGSGRGGAGLSPSDRGSLVGGYAYPTSPSNGTGRASEGHSGDPLIGSATGRPTTGDSDLPALGGAPVAGAARHERGVHRGTSNASSAYSNGATRSEGSDDFPLPAPGHGSRQYADDNPYHADGSYQPNSYSDPSYGAGQPVIRDVQARRNTRIEKPSVFPPQGNSGIAQNF